MALRCSTAEPSEWTTTHPQKSPLRKFYGANVNMKLFNVSVLSADLMSSLCLECFF